MYRLQCVNSLLKHTLIKRAFLFVLDSFGVGGAFDSGAYRDKGANTLGHIAERCARGFANQKGVRSGPLNLPHMTRLGLLEAAKLATGDWPEGMVPSGDVIGLYGCADEISKGKDTPSGHWEIAGTPVLFDWGYFSSKTESFPPDFIHALCQAAQIPGILGNCHASGTDVLLKFGEDHIRSGKPICYTSADSVFQIAAHEQVFGLDRLLDCCQIARRLLDDYNIGRVIARPFTGANTTDFQRTANRRDFSVLPPKPTLLDRLVSAGRKVHAVGKIADIFAHQGITHVIKAHGNHALFDASLKAMEECGDGDLVFTNFVDFDMLYGHRRDVIGYAAALEEFDRRLPEAMKILRPGDLMILTADHGCDPTWHGTDHTRERVPILVYGPNLAPRSIGIRSSYADIGESIAHYLGIETGKHGTSFL